ncbi:MAG TPA: ATP-binding protein [Actinomycetota bacterium]|nr:ATP-binding protein [Actinomycetota bacterium]
MNAGTTRAQASGPSSLAPGPGAGTEGGREAGADPGRAGPSLAQATRVARALAAVLDDLGFETASLFAPGPGAWQLLHRVGPVRPWHDLLDPGLLPEGGPAEYRDARTLPGVGERLAALGCVSLAVLPLPQGAVLVLDASRPPLRGGWVERARPFLELAEALAGPSWPAQGALRSHAELAAVTGLFAACQTLLSRPASTLDELLAAAREAMGAHELFLVTDRPVGAEVQAPGQPPRRIALSLRQALAGAGPGEIRPETGSALAAALGMSSPAVALGVGRDRPSLEALVAGWREGPALSAASMAMAAGAVSTARAALVARDRAVTALVDRERARMAYALHDDLVQTVTGVVLELEGLRRRIQQDPAQALATLDRSKGEVRRALAELRSMLFDLTASTEEPAPDPATLTRHLEDLIRRWRLPARVSVRGDLSGVSGRVRSAAYAVVREALANAAKHAPGARVSVELEVAGPELLVAVSDSGRGVPREVAAPRGYHLGLSALRRRLAEVGGNLEVQSRPGGGTRLLARLPVEGVTP